jgi:ribosomal protein S27E
MAAKLRRRVPGRYHDPAILSGDVPALNGFPESGGAAYPGQPLRMRSAMIRFQCPECGMGDHEVGPMAETEIHCVVCLEEHGRVIRVHCWEEEVDQARLREGLLAA